MKGTPCAASAGLIVVLILICTATLSAQVTTATILGRVQDPSEGVVPMATVTAKNDATHITKSALTNERGEFTMPYLPIGRYTIKIQASGFKTYEEQGLPLSSGQNLNRTFILELGAAAETVAVTSAAPLLNTVNAQQDINLNTRQVKELPMRNRDITALLGLGTGAASDGSSVTLNGLPPHGFSFSVDGVDAVPDSEIPSVSLYQNFNFVKGVSIEAVQEVEVSKNIFSAETGNTLSGNVNIITKSGTNQFHGSLFENYQAGGLNANNHLLARKASLVFHQYGGSLGGPIKRDRLFFFGTFEGYRRNAKQPLTGVVPSAGVRQRILAALPEASAYFDLWPLPTGPERPGDVTAFFAGSGALRNTDDTASVRVDYNIKGGHLLTGRYTRGRPLQRSPRIIIGNPRVHDGFNENVSTTYHRVWSPVLTSESRFGFNRSNLDRVDALLLVNIATVEGAGLPGPDQGRQFVKNGSTTTFEQNFATTRGPHALKFGGLYRRVLVSRIIQDVPQYRFSTVDDILANNPSGATFGFGVSEFELSRWSLGFFLQDDLRVQPTFMLNWGVRWDFSSVPKERDGRIFNRDGPFGPVRPPDQAWQSQFNMFSPRFGFAWMVGPSQKIVLRGGAGIFYTPFNFFGGPVDLVRDGVKTPTEARLARAQLQRFGIRYPDPVSRVRPLVQESEIISGTVVDPNWRNAYSLQWTLGIQRQLGSTLVWDIAYVGNRGGQADLQSRGESARPRDGAGAASGI